MPNETLATGKKNIIVTGAAGFIGTNLCERLVKEANVIAIDNYITGKQANIDMLLQNPNFEFIKHDITDPIELEAFPELKKFQVDVQGIQTIYNLACPTSPKDHEQFAIEILGANSYGVKNTLDLALKHKATYVHTSSQHIYGQPKDSNPLKEDYSGMVNPIDHRSAYDEGKRFAETIIANYQRKFEMNTKTARVFTTFGPKMAIKDGRGVPDFIVNALNNKDLEVYGDENTENTFCYVDDVIDALIRLEKSDISTPINIGHYEKMKLVDIANKIIELSDSSSKVVFKKPDWHATSYNIPDITLAKERLGWFPLVALDEGLTKTIEFTRANMRLYQI
jgi:UDP-glucuronate decarboxylase